MDGCLCQVAITCDRLHCMFCTNCGYDKFNQSQIRSDSTGNGVADNVLSSFVTPLDTNGTEVPATGLVTWFLQSSQFLESTAYNLALNFQQLLYLVDAAAQIMPTNQSSHVHSDLAKCKGWHLVLLVASLFWSEGSVSSLNDLGNDNVSLGNGWNRRVNCNASGKRSVVPPVYFEMIWEQNRWCHRVRTTSLLIHLAPLMFDGYRTTSCCMWCSILRPNASAQCYAVWTMSKHPNASMKQNTMPPKNEKGDMISVSKCQYVISASKRVCVLKDGMKCIFILDFNMQ